MQRIKTLLHVHTDFSYDSTISCQQLISHAEENNFKAIAITDHDTIEGALYARSLTDLNIIVGEEISSSDGHVIGLFLDKPIRPGMTARDTALAIKDQGGVVLLPHPFTKFFGCGVGSAAYSLVDLIDAVEVNNAQNASPLPDRQARAFANKFGLASYAGADSHKEYSISPCYQKMPEFTDAASFVQSIAQAKLVTGRHSIGYFWEMGLAIAQYLAKTHLLPASIGNRRSVSEPS